MLASSENHCFNLAGAAAFAVEQTFAPFAPSLWAAMGLCLPPGLSDAVDQRKTEFLIGRYCASEAIKKLTGESAVAVGRALDGSPVWPAGLVGSLTHSGRFVAACVAKSSDWLSLGIDTESIDLRSDNEDFLSAVVSPSERRLLLDNEFEKSVGQRLVFSAKESFYKCLYPIVRTIFDFDAAEMTHLCRTTGNITVKLSCDLGPLREGTQFAGRFAVTRLFVHTLIAIPAQHSLAGLSL
jgi:enterobactin synthetase component D